MDRVPLAWRPGLVAAALVILGCIVARPASVVRAYHRTRRVFGAMQRTLGEVLLLVEHRVTRWRRSRGKAPLDVAVRLSEAVEQRLVRRGDETVTRLAAVPRVKRTIAVGVIAATFVPSAAWLAMNRWPSSTFGRATRSAFTGWTKLEDGLPFRNGSNKVAAKEQTRTSVPTTLVRDTLAWHRADTDQPVLFGEPGDEPAVADYDGDGLTDVATFRAGTAEWSIVGRAETIELGIGDGDDVPVPGDYDGDGKAEPAVFHPSTGEWFLDGVDTPLLLGRDGDVPVPAAWSSTGRAVPAVYRPSTGEWLVSGRDPVVFGNPGDIPAPADYDGDGVADIAVFRPSTGEWWVLGLPTSPIAFGTAEDLPLPGRYASDTRAVPAVYRPSTGEVLVLGHESFDTGFTDHPPVLVRTADGLVPMTVVLGP